MAKNSPSTTGHFLLLIALVFAGGCIANIPFFTQTQKVGNGLFMQMRADPQTVFAGGDVRLYIDVENQNPREISDVYVNVFDTGYLDTRLATPEGITIVGPVNARVSCDKRISLMKPGAFSSLTCVLTSRSIEQESLTTTISASTTYTTDFSFVQVIDIMNEEEYARRQQQNQLTAKPSKYSYSDKNVQMDVEFSEPLPVVVRSTAKEYYMYITIKNVGNGFISDIKQGQLIVIPTNSIIPRVDDKTVQTMPTNIVNCPIDATNWNIQPVGKTFPKITCKISLPLDVRIIENYGLLVRLKYNYDVRNGADVKIIR